ncbi:hypothetical protein Btru_047306 [Bulinus truncatus]|nr:hypothetical protein Btru_047306 [Bulinus truncatus]
MPPESFLYPPKPNSMMPAPPESFLYPPKPNSMIPAPPESFLYPPKPNSMMPAPQEPFNGPINSPNEVVATTTSMPDDVFPDILEDFVFWLSVDGSSGIVPHTDVRFNKKSFDEFLQCLCKPDNAQCEVSVAGSVVLETAAIRGDPPTAPTNTYVCSAAEDAKVICKRGELLGDGASQAFRILQEKRIVGIYWDGQQIVNVHLLRKHVGSMLECTGQCWIYEDGVEDGHRDDRGILPTGIALIIVCVSVFILAVALIVIFMVKTKKFAWFKPSHKHKKPNLATKLENAENFNRLEKFKLPPINSVFANIDRLGNPDVNGNNPSAPENHNGVGREEMGGIPFDSPPAYPLLVWPMDTRFRVPGSDPPPYHTLVQSTAGGKELKGPYTLDEQRHSSLDLTRGTLTNVAI